jgi:perosamine synthetase
VLREREASYLHPYRGPRVRERLLPYDYQSIQEEDIQAVVDVLRSDWITTGPKIGESESLLS